MTNSEFCRKLKEKVDDFERHWVQYDVERKTTFDETDWWDQFVGFVENAPTLKGI